MKKNILIATQKFVSKDNWEPFCVQIQEIALEECHVEVGAMELRSGPGCANLALVCEGDEKNIEQFGNKLCLALMPSRWCETSSEVVAGHYIEREVAQ